MDSTIKLDSRTVKYILGGAGAFCGLRLIYKAWVVSKYAKRFKEGTKKHPDAPTSGWLGAVPALKEAANSRLDLFLTTVRSGRTGSGRILMPVFMDQHFMVTENPAVVKHMLKDAFDSYVKMPIGGYPVHPFVDLMGNGIFVVNHGKHIPDKGQAWYDQRKIASQIFTQQNFRSYFLDVFRNNGVTMVNEMRKTLGKPTDLQQWMFSYTMDSFGQIAFGTDFHTLEGEFAAFPKAFDLANAEMFPFIDFDMPITYLIGNLLPWPLSELGYAIFRRTNKRYVEIMGHVKICHSTIVDLIQNRKAQEAQKAANGEEPSSDLLALFMAAGKSEGREFSDSFLRDIVLNFIIAGRDTTACTLSWAFKELLQNPKTMDLLVEEIDVELSGDDVDYSKLKAMKYLNGVVQEALRLHPAVPVDNKLNIVDDTWPDGTFIPAGSQTFYFPWAMGRSEAIWGSDALEFKPERWMSGELRSQYEFPVFQGGPRICLGKEMAILEAKMVLVNLLQNFKFTLVPGQVLTYSTMITMSLKNGLQVIVEERQ